MNTYDMGCLLYTSGSADHAALSAAIRGKLLLLALPPFYETVSSTRIRASVDQNLDISMLVAPVVQTYIYECGLYVRSPELKNVLRREELYFRLSLIHIWEAVAGGD